MKRLAIGLFVVLLLAVCVLMFETIKQRDAEIVILKAGMSALAEEVVDAELQRQALEHYKKRPLVVGLPEWWEYCI